MFSSSRFFYIGFSYILGVAVSVSSAQAQLYRADINNSEWKTSGDPFNCSLTHSIPVFGKATFSRKAGGGELFYVESIGKVVFPAGQTLLETAPPAWRSDVLPESIGEVMAVTGNRPISLNANQTTSVVKHLSAGTNLMYTSQTMLSTSSEPSVMRLMLTAKGFPESYKKYQQCIADLIPYTFAQVSRTSIRYAEHPVGLSANNKADLNKIARYIKADAKVAGVFVDGHSDNSGSSEEREVTSKQAAEWVTAYLTEQGVAADKITTRWHADKFLIANNKTDAGRAENRRVTVRLEDEATHKEYIKKEEENRKAEEKAVAEKQVAEAKKTQANTSATTSASASSSGKMSPEEISRMVEGLDILK